MEPTGRLQQREATSDKRPSDNADPAPAEPSGDGELGRSLAAPEQPDGGGAHPQTGIASADQPRSTIP